MQQFFFPSSDCVWFGSELVWREHLKCRFCFSPLHLFIFPSLALPLSLPLSLFLFCLFSLPLLLLLSSQNKNGISHPRLFLLQSLCIICSYESPKEELNTVGVNSTLGDLFVHWRGSVMLHTFVHELPLTFFITSIPCIIPYPFIPISCIW